MVDELEPGGALSFRNSFWKGGFTVWPRCTDTTVERKQLEET